MEIENLKQKLMNELSSRQQILTRIEVGKVVESTVLVEARCIQNGEDVSRILNSYPELANHVVDDAKRVNLIEATRYVYEDWLKRQLKGTADEFYIAQFGNDFSPSDNAAALLKDASEAMENYWMEDARGIGALAIRNQMDDLAEAERLAGLKHEPSYAHPMLAKLKSVCLQSEAFKDQLARRWELAKDVLDNRELFEIDRNLAFKI
jgi:hypothetical protein